MALEDMLDEKGPSVGKNGSSSTPRAVKEVEKNALSDVKPRDFLNSEPRYAILLIEQQHHAAKPINISLLIV